MVKLFLDSGAFSAWTKNAVIDIDKYIRFIKDNIDRIEFYANLDVIGDAEATYKNQCYMENNGLSPVPVFHTGREDVVWLRKYIDKGYNYIALGGIAGGNISKRKLVMLLDDVFGNYICDSDGVPRIKIHGFGLTSFSLMLRYPWYSVDSTSWFRAGSFGNILVPVYVKGRFRYDRNPWIVGMSTTAYNNYQGGGERHYNLYSSMEKRVIKEYINSNGIALGKSEYRWESLSYKLKKGERYVLNRNKENCFFGDREIIGDVLDKVLVEYIIEPGVINSYLDRHRINIQFYKKFVDCIPEYPSKFVYTHMNKTLLI